MAQFVTVAPLIRVIRGKDQFTYQTDLELQVGELVWTPWRSRSVVGVVTEMNVAPFARSKQIIERLNIVLPKSYWRFLQWFADYYYISLASALHAALPDFVRRPKPYQPNDHISKLRVGIANQERLQLIQQLAVTLGQRQQSTTVLYQRLNEVAAVVLGLVKQTQSSANARAIVLICPEEAQLAYWQGVLKQFNPILVEPQHTGSVRLAWEALMRQQAKIILGTKRLSLLPLTEASQVMVLDAEHTAHKQWGHNPRYHVQRVVDQQTAAVYFSYAPRLEQYAQHSLQTDLLTSQYLPKLLITQPFPGQVLNETVQAQITEANSVVVWHQRTGLSRSLVCLDCKTWIPSVEATHCPQCHGQRLKLAGFGTAMLKKQLAELYPHRTVIEVTASNALPQYNATKGVIYVGTSAIFNRLPWQQIDLAVATSLDSQLAWPDFRSHEQTLQQLMWLRNHVPNLVAQTWTGEHPVLQALSEPFPASWYQRTLTDRRKLKYPPRGDYIRLMNTITKQEQVITDLSGIPAGSEWIIDREC